jgi:isocitrate lyase
MGGQRREEDVINVGDDSSQAAGLQREWETSQRWAGIQRDHSGEDVIRRRGPLTADHILARSGARRLRELLGRENAVQVLGADTANQAGQLVQARPQAIYLSGDSVPQLVRQINCAIVDAGQRAVPIVADAQAPFDRELDVFQLMESMIEAGAGGVHFEDRRPWPTEDGDPTGKVLLPTGECIETLKAARLAADVLNVPALLMARTYAHETSLLTSDVDERDHEFLTGERTADGLHRLQPGLYACITRALAFAPYADLLWLETSAPNLAEARAFADIIYSQYPGKLLAYSCSPAFNWAQLDDPSIAQFQETLAALGYRFQLTSTSIRQPEPIDPDASTGAPAGSKDVAQFAVSAV